jgi:hypothetical protein
MLHKVALLSLLLITVSPSLANADSLQQRGEATFRWFGIPVYTARLFTPSGQTLNWQDDLRLELTYQRALTRDNLVGSTQSEMQRLGYASPSKTELQACFRNVARGDNFSAITDGPDQVRLYFNGAEQCRFNQPNIRRGFLSIFLSNNSRAPNFSRRLRND